jgi:VCBS repeat-containing protein
MPKPPSPPASGQKAINDAARTGENTTITVDVLANDPKGSVLSALNGLSPTSTVQLTGGASVHIVNSQIVYDPGSKFDYLAVGQTGQDTFTYSIIAKNGTVSTATVTIAVQGVNDAPLARADSYAVAQDAVLAVSSALGVLSNDTDVDSGTLAASIVGGPSHGSLTMVADGSFSYTPDEGFYGQDSFSYATSDGLLVSAAQTVTLSVAKAWIATSGSFTLGINDGIDLDTGAVAQFANQTDIYFASDIDVALAYAFSNFVQVSDPSNPSNYGAQYLKELVDLVASDADYIDANHSSLNGAGFSFQYGTDSYLLRTDHGALYGVGNAVHNLDGTVTFDYALVL